jgi:hypothetical protein
MGNVNLVTHHHTHGVPFAGVQPNRRVYRTYVHTTLPANARIR